MTLERLQDCLTQAQELLDELPVVYLTASQETTYQIDILNETLDELFESAANKGYTDPRKRREHRQSPGRDNSRPQIVSSASQATNPPLPEPERSQPEPESNKEPAVDKIAVLVGKLLKQEGRRPLHPVDIVELLTTRPTQVRRQQELAATARIFSGVEWADEDDWSFYLEGLSIDEPTTFDQHRRASLLCDRVIDRTQRLHQRHTIIGRYTQTTSSQHIIHTILIKVDWVRFAEDYNTLRPTEKSAWLVSGFQLANPDMFSNLDDQGKKAKMQDLADDFKTWKRQVGKETTARNRLYELFLEYGAIIILDPVWNVQALRDHAGASIHKAFLRLSSRIRSDDAKMNQDHRLAKLQPAIEQALLCIVLAISGADAMEYVNEFMEDFSALVKIPRMAGFE